MKNVNLETERLKIRNVHLSDLDDVHALHSSPEVDRYNTLGLPESISQTQSILCEWVLGGDKEEGRKLTFAVESHDGDFIGLIALNFHRKVYKSAEVWFKYHQEFWNKGYATEALSELIAFAFDKLNLHRLEAGCALENKGSKRVLEKVGMFLEGQKRKCLPLDEGWSDTLEFAMLAEDRK